MGIWLVRNPIRDHAGKIMFAAVAVFGLAHHGVRPVDARSGSRCRRSTIMGAADMISVYVRATLVQLATPDEVRGRVTAVNSVFIGASNELGEFRAGTMAALIGAVPAVVVGGVGTLAVAALWTRALPAAARHAQA